MSKKAIFGSFISLIIVVVTAAALLTYMDYNRYTIKSDTAEINAQTYGIGTDYTGLITAQFVQEGDDVIAGQTLFRIKSSTLIDLINSEKLKVDQLIYPLTPEGEILLKASRAGTISKIYYNEGSFVPANKEVAAIIDKENIKVTATYNLARRDFAMLSKSSRLSVRLPDGQRVSSTISSITVIEQNDTVKTEVEAELDKFDIDNLVAITGAPVDATLYLREDTVWNRVVKKYREAL